MGYIRQFMTSILTDGTDELLRATISEAIKEADKSEGGSFHHIPTYLPIFLCSFYVYKLFIIAEPKLLAKSSALAALSSLGKLYFYSIFYDRFFWVGFFFPLL